MTEPTPEAWAQIRHAYENTDQPLAHICAAHAVSIPTVRYRMKRWGWTRRKPFVPRQQPVAAMDDAFSPPPVRAANGGEGSGVGGGYPYDAASPPTPQTAQGEDRTATTVQRLQSAVARVLPAIETIIARLGAGNLSSDGLEKAGRALGALTRTLRELNALLAEHNAQPDGFRCEYCDMPPEDADAFRDELARRINAFVESRRNPDGTFNV